MKSIETNNNFTKQHTLIAKGIAILLMVYHHLFVLPERLGSQYFSVINFFGYDLQSLFANFGKICVCIFVFLSGIGIYHSLSKETCILAMYKKVGKHALKFLINYWVILLFVYPYGIYIGFFEPTVKCFLNAIIGVSNSVMEWWFIPQYMVLLFIAPTIIWLFKKTNKLVYRMLPLGLMYFFVLPIRIFIHFFGFPSYIFNDVYFSYIKYFTLLSTLSVFVIGIITAKYNLYALYLKIPGKNLKAVLFIAAGTIIRIIFSNSPTSMTVDFIVVPLFVFGTTSLLINTKTSNILFYFAKHSTNIWLTHTFWCYYFFNHIVLLPYYSVFIYLWLLILSLLTSYLINLIYIPIHNLIFTKEHKLCYKNYFYIIGKN